MTFPTITFDAPVEVFPDSDIQTSEITILEIHDQNNIQQLWAVLSFATDPISGTRLLVYEHDEYLNNGDWTYDSIADRIQNYYENGRSFPHYANPAPDVVTEDPAPTGE